MDDNGGSGLRILSPEEEAELRATPGVVFPPRWDVRIELSEADAVLDGIEPLPAGKRRVDFERAVLHGPEHALLVGIILACQRAKSRTVTYRVEGVGRETLGALIEQGRIKLLSETLIED